MHKCPICGFRNPDANDRCLRCSALLKRDTDIIDQAMYEGSQKAKTYHSQRLWAAPLDRIRRMFDFPSWRVPDNLPYRFPFTAGLLSLLPGLGQVYNHQTYKGITLGTAWLVWLILCVFTITMPFSNALLLVLVLAWLAIWNDAISTAIRANAQNWSLRNSLAMFCAILFILGSSITLLQFFGLSIFNLVIVRKNVHAPVIHAGDRVWVNNLAYLFLEARYGDVLYFDPPSFAAERGNDRYAINIGRYFQKVMAREGDKIEKRNGRWYRNEIPVPGWQAPIGDSVLPDMSYIVPLGCVFAPITYIPSDSMTMALISMTSGKAASTISYAFEPGFIFQKWEQASMPSYKQIWGRAVAVVDSPAHRVWLRQ